MKIWLVLWSQLMLVLWSTHTSQAQETAENLRKGCPLSLSGYDNQEAFSHSASEGAGLSPIEVVSRWHTVFSYIDWVAYRSDLEWDGLSGTTTTFCRRFDRRGNIIAFFSSIEGSRTWEYWQDSSTPNRNGVTLFVKDDPSPSNNSGFLPIFELYMSPDERKVMRRRLSGRREGEIDVAAEIDMQAQDGHLVLFVGDFERLHIDENGALFRLDEWPCGRSDPCGDDFARTDLSYDANGNLERRRTNRSGLAETYSPRYETNQQGDWILRWMGAGAEFERRVVEYRSD